MTVTDQLRAHHAGMLDALEALVSVESPSADLAATTACADAVAAFGRQLLGAEPERCVVDGRTHLRWTFGAPRVLLLGHYDTVWPVGTLARWPFAVLGEQATGPGTFDMKAGIVQGFYALAALDDLDGVAVLLTSDEELGSPTSRGLIEETAQGLSAALVLEPSAAGALKTGRKGVSNYVVQVVGRAAHAGLEPEKGANALLELAAQVRDVAELARPDLLTTVTPTVATAGTATNVVPASASFEVDVRVATEDEQRRVDDAFHALRPTLEGTSLLITGGPNRPPLPESASAELFARAQALAADLGVGPLGGVTVGGGSDGNFTAGIGVPTLDGLGPVGDGAHAEGEHVLVDAMPGRAALVAALVRDLLRP
jgi:glutamate carboxypeptidase